MSIKTKATKTCHGVMTINCKHVVGAIVIFYIFSAFLTYGVRMAAVEKTCSHLSFYDRCDIIYLTPVIQGATWPLYWTLHGSYLMFRELPENRP